MKNNTRTSCVLEKFSLALVVLSGGRGLDCWGSGWPHPQSSWSVLQRGASRTDCRVQSTVEREIRIIVEPLSKNTPEMRTPNKDTFSFPKNSSCMQFNP